MLSDTEESDGEMLLRAALICPSYSSIFLSKGDKSRNCKVTEMLICKSDNNPNKVVGRLCWSILKKVRMLEEIVK